MSNLNSSYSNLTLFDPPNHLKSIIILKQNWTWSCWHFNDYEGLMLVAVNEETSRQQKLLAIVFVPNKLWHHQKYEMRDTFAVVAFLFPFILKGEVQSRSQHQNRPRIFTRFFLLFALPTNILTRARCWQMSARIVPYLKLLKYISTVAYCTSRWRLIQVSIYLASKMPILFSTKFWELSRT